jgi:hypothetical protein
MEAIYAQTFCGGRSQINLRCGDFSRRTGEGNSRRAFLTNAQDDDFAIEMPTFEQLVNVPQLTHLLALRASKS